MKGGISAGWRSSIPEKAPLLKLEDEKKEWFEVKPTPSRNLNEMRPLVRGAAHKWRHEKHRDR